MQTLLLYRWLLEMVQNSSFCLNNTQITCSALITYNYLHYTELMFTLIKCPLFSKRYLETFISMAGKKKKEDGSQCLSDENILKKKKIKSLVKGQDILTLIFTSADHFSLPMKPQNILLPDVFMLPFIKLIKFTLNKNKITAILKQFYEEVTFMWKNKFLYIKSSTFNSFRSFM